MKDNLHLDLHTAPKQTLRGTLANLWHPMVLSAGPEVDAFAVLSARRAMGTT